MTDDVIQDCQQLVHAGDDGQVRGLASGAKVPQLPIGLLG
jgi:hypothetical protein